MYEEIKCIMQPKISIIVPVYKVELYLRQCIDSIITQTYKNLEIILVDDGSPDDCGAICNEYAEHDNRIIVIHKENGGLSDARNAGLDIAKGNYIGFVDSDDWIEPDMYESLYNNLVDNDADIACCGYYESYVNENIFHVLFEETILLSKEQAMKESFFYKRVSVCAWDKLYKKDIFMNIRYPFGKIHEDEFVILDIFSQADKVIVSTVPKYYYRQRNGSIIQQPYTAKKLHVIEAFEHKLQIAEKSFAGIADLSRCQLLRVNNLILSKIIMCKNYRQMPEYKTILSTLRKNFSYIMRSDLFTKNEKIKAVALQINAMLFKWIVVLNLKFRKKTGGEKILFE